MIYHPDADMPLLPSTNIGFWVKDDQVYDVSLSSHIRFLMDHTDLFGFSLDDILALYAKHRERIGSEGITRIKLITKATRKGWIRVRRHLHPDYWSLQCDVVERRKDIIQNFILWAIENGIMAQDATAQLMGYFGFNDPITYEWRDGGVRRIIGETTT